LPYDFKQSNFELTILKKALELNDFKNKGLEIYYNGERGLTKFVINCFAKEGHTWKNIGKYTTDFLIVQRTADNALHKALILETKGAGYSNDPVFQKKRKFVETDFIKLNQEKFGYPRFDFLYLEDSDNITANTVKLGNKINQFFKA
jgi:type III restriction enzyme